MIRQLLAVRTTKKREKEKRRSKSQTLSLDLDSKTPATKIKPSKAELAEAFERFWRVYPKRVAKDAAAKAFAVALKSGVDPGELITGAMRYAAERSGENPKYTKHPATWLHAGCWQD